MKERALLAFGGPAGFNRAWRFLFSRRWLALVFVALLSCGGDTLRSKVYIDLGEMETGHYKLQPQLRVPVADAEIVQGERLFLKRIVIAKTAKYQPGSLDNSDAKAAYRAELLRGFNKHLDGKAVVTEIYFSQFQVHKQFSRSK